MARLNRRRLFRLVRALERLASKIGVSISTPKSTRDSSEGSPDELSRRLRKAKSRFAGRLSASRSCQNFFHDASMHVSQPKVAALIPVTGRSWSMPNRCSIGVQIVDVNNDFLTAL